MIRPPTSVTQYFAHLPAARRARLRQMRAAIRAAVPADAVEVISYGIPAFRNGKVLLWYAAFADHVSLFPGASMVARFKPQLARFKTSKGTIHFPLAKPLPVSLVKRIVRARVREVIAD